MSFLEKIDRYLKKNGWIDISNKPGRYSYYHGKKGIKYTFGDSDFDEKGLARIFVELSLIECRSSFKIRRDIIEEASEGYAK